MADTDRDGARGELYVECPRGHEVHVAWVDRPVRANVMLDDDEVAAVRRFVAGAGGLSARCPDCDVVLHGAIVQGREL